MLHRARSPIPCANPNGRVLHHMTLTILEDAVLVDTAPQGFDSLLKYLQMMIFRSEVTVAEVSRAILTVMRQRRSTS